MLEKQVSKHLQAITDDLKAGQNKIYEGIILEAFPVNTITEVIFRNYYLPCFAGFVQPPNWMLNWINIAGSPTAEVGVTDEQGNILFKVPPLIAATNVILHGQGDTLSEVFSRREMLRNNISVDHNEYLHQQLDQKTQELGNPTNNEMVRRWEEIFQRYNVPRNNTGNTGTQFGGGDDMFEY